MATFKLTGGVSKFRDKLIEGMVANSYDREFAERTFRQLEGFGSYGFPESHASSFALVAYASAWLKCWHPDAFCAALLNSQPMGFYAPAQIVRDARDHGRHSHRRRRTERRVARVRAMVRVGVDAQLLVNLGLVHRDGELIPYWHLLRKEHGESHRVVKALMRQTHASERSVTHWLSGQHGPDSLYFLQLVVSSPVIRAYAQALIKGRSRKGSAIRRFGIPWLQGGPPMSKASP